MLRNVQQGIVRDRALVVHVDMAQRVGVVAALVPIEGVILLLGDLVERYGFGVVLVFVRVLFLAALGHLHADGEADVIAIALDEALDAVLVKVLAVVLCAVAVLISCHIRQQLQRDLRSHGVLVAGVDGIALNAFRLPYICLIGAKGTGLHGDTFCHHESGVEAHTELTNDLVVLCQIVFLLELKRTAVGDGAQMLLQLLLGHTDTVIGNGESACVLINGDGNAEIRLIHAHAVIRQRAEVQLVNGITGVGNQFPQENLLVCVNRVNHHVH